MFKKYLDKIMPAGSPPETAKLEDYIRKAWTKDPSIQPFTTEATGSAGEETTLPPPPTLRRDRQNRIIYYIGSFHPPHLGHAALLDHAYRHSRDPDGFNAVAVLVMAHGDSWVQRKVRNDEKPLRLTFDQRRRLVEDGLGEEGRRRWLWVLPRDVNAWWVFQGKLHDACARDGFALEFHELLGPDYVKADRPQCHGWHGVVTSNICRTADFDRGAGHSLLPMVGFQPWEQEQTEMQQQQQGQDQGEEETNSSDSEVWMCRKHVQGHGDYSIRYIRAQQPGLDPDLSSTQLRSIIAASPPDELAVNLRGLATNPELLIQVMQETKEQQQSR